MEEKTKFDLEDRVRLTNGIMQGKEGVIVAISLDGTMYDVFLENFNAGHGGLSHDGTHNHLILKEHEMELVADKAEPEYSLPSSDEGTKVMSPNQHYETAVQPIEFMQANMAPEEFVGFLKGNIIKYAGRCGRKDAPLKEAKKIKQYAGWLVEALEGKTINPRG